MASEGLLDGRLTLGKEWLSGVTPVWGKLMQRAGKGLRSMVVMVVEVVGTCQQPLPLSPLRSDFLPTQSAARHVLTCPTFNNG